MNDCFVCKKNCPCDCLSVDTDYGTIHFCSLNCYQKSNKECGWDAEFGEFNNHFHQCEFGEMFKEKWKEAIKQENIYRDLYYQFHVKWKALAYPKVEVNPSK
jgi:hypothetical protein